MPPFPRFLLDKNIPAEVKTFLSSQNISVEYAPKGVTDSVLAALARQKKLTLVTRDSDFSNASLFPPKAYFGIIFLRIHPPTAEALMKALSLLLKQVSEFRGKTFILEKSGFEVVA